MAQAAQNMDVLSNTENIKILSNVLKTNVSACTSIGSFYLPQIGRIFLDMLGLYKAVSGIISETIAKEGSSYRFFQQQYEQCLMSVRRSRCDEDPQSSPVANSQKGNSQTHGDVYQKGRGFGSCQQQFHATVARRYPW